MEITKNPNKIKSLPEKTEIKEITSKRRSHHKNRPAKGG